MKAAAVESALLRMALFWFNEVWELSMLDEYIPVFETCMFSASYDCARRSSHPGKLVAKGTPVP